MMKKLALPLLTLTFSSAYAYEAKILKNQLPATLEAFIEKANKDTGSKFKTSDFTKMEERSLATSNFVYYVQKSSGFGIRGTALRMWKDKNGNLILGEMHLNEKSPRFPRLNLAHTKAKNFDSSLIAFAKSQIEDSTIKNISSEDVWSNEVLVREFKITTLKGVHTVKVSLEKGIVTEKSFEEFPQMDLKANVYPIYEVAEGMRDVLNFEERALKYINEPAPGKPVLLRGKFVNINLHPNIKRAFPGINFPLLPTTGVAGYQGKVVESQEELLSRIPQRDEENNTLEYINGGFDEIQVYYATTVLMDTLNKMGFTDPELSTKAFEAILFDPNISYRDNAYYTQNTINFTTYSKGEPNKARDNGTIWHELGHGVMDRLMGPNLAFADSGSSYGGLSEGMADFVAQLVVNAQTNGQDFLGASNFRIINQTAFYLTNEFHDDGEAYGGAMNDMLLAAMKKEGNKGLLKLADVTLEAMRLTRNHPKLSPKEWFAHMIYADDLGSAVRAPGELKGIINAALAGRNFSFDDSKKMASMTVKVNNSYVLTDQTPGSRNNPIRACESNGTNKHTLSVQLTQGDTFEFQFPVTVKLEFKAWALQGAINWEGEDRNPLEYTLNSPADVLKLNIKANMKCDSINDPSNACKDYAYVQIFNKGESKPRAKKRFYLLVKDGGC